MTQDELQTLKEELALTAEAMGRELSPGGVRMIASDLADYPLNNALEAIKDCRRTLSRFPTVADIVSRIESQDGRPGPEEAWAKIPKDEFGSVVWTAEMAIAYGAAHPHLREGNPIGARMAFIEVYNREVKAARERNDSPTWTPCLGTDESGRQTALMEAVQKNRLSLEHAERITSLAVKGPERIAIEDHSEPEVPPDEALKKIREITARIAKPVPGAGDA